MSWEGYAQLICEKGHYWQGDADWWDGPPPSCSCGAQTVWWNIVDDTNCDAWGKVDIKVKTPAKGCTCKECGRTHTAVETTYEVPTKYGNRWNEQTQEWDHLGVCSRHWETADDGSHQWVDGKED